MRKRLGPLVSSARGRRRPLARRAAAVRARTKLKLPDAFALATAIHAEKRGHDDVRLETFDKKVNEAFADLHPLR